MVNANYLVGANGKHFPVCCFAFSIKCDNNRVIVRSEMYSGYNIKKVILSELQLVVLEELGIYATEGDWHHLVQQVLWKNLSMVINSERNDKEKYCDLEEIFEFEFANLLPKQIHQIYNKIFQNCLIPQEVIERLDKIFREEKLFSPRKNDIIELFSFMSVLLNDINDVNIGKICRLRKSKNSVVVSDLLKLLCLSENDIREYIEMLFLYPGYREKSEYFSMLRDINKRLDPKEKRI
ncbi:MAG: hypothetical protein KAS01_03030 [Candidatus Pacebacteria bacterium]|nr:hypothetical protein [Candidatus Paceibacterota bacterium]